jgi:hypothetical protein
MLTAPGRVSWRIALIALAIGIGIGSAVVVFLQRNHPDADRHAETRRTYPAVEKVLHAYEDLDVKYLKAKRGVTPVQYARAMGEFCEELERQPMAGCPRDFQVAVEHNIRAIRDAQAILRRCPNGFLEGMAMGAANYLGRGEMDGGLGRLEKEVQAALDRIQDTSNDVERIAAKYSG